jgi:hypothetical protein
MTAAVQNHGWTAFAGAKDVERTAANIDRPAYLRIVVPVPPSSDLLIDDPCQREREKCNTQSFGE